MKKSLHNFRFAWNGLVQAFKTELNLTLHAIFAVIALVAAYFCDFNFIEFSLVVICIGLVLSAEIFNTAIEKIMDFIHPDYHEKVKVIKDLAAAAVLIMGFVCVAVACFLFIPKLM